MRHCINDMRESNVVWRHMNSVAFTIRRNVHWVQDVTTKACVTDSCKNSEVRNRSEIGKLWFPTNSCEFERPVAGACFNLLSLLFISCGYQSAILSYYNNNYYYYCYYHHYDHLALCGDQTIILLVVKYRFFYTPISFTFRVVFPRVFSVSCSTTMVMTWQWHYSSWTWTDLT